MLHEVKQTQNICVALRGPEKKLAALLATAKTLSYTGVDGIGDIASAAFQILPRICDQNRRFRVLIKPLLHSAIVSTFLLDNLLCSPRVFVVIDIAQVSPGDVLRRLLCGGGGPD